MTTRFPLPLRILALASLLLASRPCLAQGPLLLREAFSREFSIHVGGEQTPLVKEAVSREVSLFIGTSFDKPYPETFSREMSVLITTPAIPARVTQLAVTVSPTGDSAILNWCDYNEIAQNDVVRYKVYISTTPFTDVTGLTPYVILPAGTCSLSVSNLTAWQDHYFAVVAEDALGGADAIVDYSAAYVLAPQAISRELSIFVGGEPASPYAQAFSREMSVLVTTPAAPDRVTELIVNSSPTGDSAVLTWSAYDELLQRDVVRYDIYISTQPFTTVSNHTPFASVAAGTFSLTVSNLTAYQDHYFAVVAVDALNGFDATVDYSAAYALAPEAISREFSIFVGSEPVSPFAQVISREMSILVPDNTIPAPVTGLDSGFDAVTSVSAFSALDLIGPLTTNWRSAMSFVIGFTRPRRFSPTFQEWSRSILRQQEPIVIRCAVCMAEIFITWRLSRKTFWETTVRWCARFRRRRRLELWAKFAISPSIPPATRCILVGWLLKSSTRFFRIITYISTLDQSHFAPRIRHELRCERIATCDGISIPHRHRGHIQHGERGSFVVGRDVVAKSHQCHRAII